MYIKGNNNIVMSGINNINVRQLVGYGKLREALKELMNEDNKNEIIALLGRLSFLEKEVSMGVISFDNEKIEKNKITQAILSYCGTDEQEIFKPEQKEMKYSNLSKSDVANVLLSYLKNINPTNRPEVGVLQQEVQLAQSELQYTKLQAYLEELAKASVSPNVNNFHDTVFKSNYDNWVANTIECLTKYIKVIDKHSTNNELPVTALSRLKCAKTVENLFLWVESLKRKAGSDLKVSDKLSRKLGYWLEYLKNSDEDEIEIIIDNQIIDDITKYV